MPVHRWMIDRISAVLMAETAHYELLAPNDPDHLKRHVTPGDVILIEGSQRISLVIKYLTQSRWSHCALYVADEPLRTGSPEYAEELRARFGDEASHLIVEALPEGVVHTPLVKYLQNNIRVCRPYNLRRDDRARVLRHVSDRVGHDYDIQNIIDLARYFFPIGLIPRRFRPKVLSLGSGHPSEVICSRMIAEAFHSVGFPVLPRIEFDPELSPRASRWSRWLGHVPESAGQFFRRPTPLVTPADYDLSPYFEVVKFNVIEELKLDYRKIPWADDPPDSASNG